MARNLSSFLCAFVFLASAYAYDDSLYIYDANKTGSWRKQIIPIPNPGNDTGSGYTESSVGQLGGKINVDTAIASTCDSDFSSQMLTATSCFNLDDYPVRTNVKIFYYDQGNIRQHASGTFISPRHILTAAHNIVYGNRWWGEDAFLIAPAYKNGHFSAVCDTVRATRYYFRFSGNSECCPTPNIDFGILELDRPVGNQTGWCGYGHDLNLYSSMRSNVLHCFSYPGVPIASSPIQYNGDTMYYNYTHGPNFSYPVGAPGQSGSTLFYWDNNRVTVYGVRSTAAGFEEIDFSVFHFISFVLSMPSKITQPTTLRFARSSGRADIFSKSAILKGCGPPYFSEHGFINLLGRTVEKKASNLYILNFKNLPQSRQAKNNKKD